MSFIIWLFVDIVGIASYTGNIMKTGKFKSWYPLALISLVMWISVLLSYTITKYYLSVCSYFREGKFQLVENGIYTTQFDTVCILACSITVLILQVVALLFVTLCRNLNVENSPRVMTLYYIFGILLGVVLGIASLWSNFHGYNRVQAMSTLHGYYVTVGYFILGQIIWNYQTARKIEENAKANTKSFIDLLSKAASKNLSGK